MESFTLSFNILRVLREIIFPDINEIKGPPKIEKHGFITDHGAEMSLFVYKNRLMYMDVDNLRCIDYFTKEAFSPIADSKISKDSKLVI